MSADAAFPSWVLLEPFVFLRDDVFSDRSKAPIRASGTTSWNAPFRVAFSLIEPPYISRLYAQLPGFPDPMTERPLAILATHRHLVLFRVATLNAAELIEQNFFIYNASDADNPSLIKALPQCTAPYMDFTRRDGRLPRHPRRPSAEEEGPQGRLLGVKSMGLLCRGVQDFVVVEVQVFKPSTSKVFADICLLRSCTSSAGPEEDKLGGKWEFMRVPILHSDNPDDIWQLCLWRTDTVIPSGDWLCWIDYCRGILFCDVLGGPIPTVFFVRFPLDKFPDRHNRSEARSWLYRGVSAIDGGRALKFVDVARDDGIGYGALKPGGGFTIRCHTLTLGSKLFKKDALGIMVLKDTLGSMVWKEDCTITSNELCSVNHYNCFQYYVPMFPQVNIDKPHIVHFLMSTFENAIEEMWLVAIDMRTATVESFSNYINGTVDADLIRTRSSCPRPFLHCEFPKYLRLSRESSLFLQPEHQ